MAGVWNDPIGRTIPNLSQPISRLYRANHVVPALHDDGGVILQSGHSVEQLVWTEKPVIGHVVGLNTRHGEGA